MVCGTLFSGGLRISPPEALEQNIGKKFMFLSKYSLEKNNNFFDVA
jgi:hypothetical protein